MGLGNASGKDKAEAAAKEAIASPLLETSIKGATGVILSITASPDVGLEDIDTACNMLTSECNPAASIIWGVAFDGNLEDEIRITIIATNFSDAPASVSTDAKKTANEAQTEDAPKKSGDQWDDFLDSMFN